MLHAGLDLSRKKVDVCLLSPAGEIVDEWGSPPDADGLRGLAARAAMWGPAVRGVIESMNGARFVHDQLEEHGWEVLIADAVKVKGLAPLACKTDKIDARVLATLSARDLVPEIWLPDPAIRRERELMPALRSPPKISTGPQSAFSRVWEKTALGLSFIAVAIGPSDAAQCGPMIS
jgi:transposase